MRKVMSSIAVAAVIGAGAAMAAQAEEKKGSADEWAGIGNFVLYPTSLMAQADVAAPCERVWDVLTRLDLLQKWAPHLHLASTTGQARAEKRGDLVAFSSDKPSGQVTGQFILASPVPN